MSTALRPRRLVNVAMLTGVWCGLWQDISAANLLAGALIGFVATWPGIGPPALGGVRPIPLIILGLVVLKDLVRSTVSVASEILTPTDHTEEAVVAVQVPPEGRDHLLLLTIAITLTPGTAVVDTDPDTGTLYLHLLHQDKRDETVIHTKRLVNLACAALPSGNRGASA
ncbi:MAG: Na+/H+ antiporter subunit E [Actinomycetota bacterium]